MQDALLWWLIIQLLALGILPVAWRLGRSLPDGGAVLAKPLGLLLPAYVLWLGLSFGIFDNSSRATPVIVCLVVALAAWLAPWGSIYARQDEQGYLNRRLASLAHWARANLGAILLSELMFAIVYAGAVLLRAHNPEIAGTEKPMEFAFLNAILRSPQFPPNDPWLSGFSISYYYFGYFITAMLTRMSGISSGITFNLMLAALAGLSAAGIAGLLANMTGGRWRRWLAGVAGVYLLLLAANMEGFVEVLNSNRLLRPTLWSWLNIRDLPEPGAFAPAGWGWPSDNWWWWRATRVLGEKLPGRDDYTISEFPFFSFLLGDLHPHVLALPFDLLVLALGLAVYRSEERFDLAWLRRNWLVALLVAVIAGGLGFMNTWDIVLGLGVLGIAYAFQSYRVRAGSNAGLDWRWLRQLAMALAGLGSASIILYGPFYLFFHSQAQGFGVSVWATNPVHLLIVWAIFLPGLLGLYWFAWRSPIPAREANESRPERAPAEAIELARPVATRLVPALEVAVVPVLPPQSLFASSGQTGLSGTIGMEEAKEMPRGTTGLPVGTALLMLAVILPLLLWALVVVIGTKMPGVAEMLAIADLPNLMLAKFPVLAVLATLLIAGGAMLVRRLEKRADDSTSFVLVLAVVAVGFVWLCELFYLRDLFNTRMNTVFKFYFQAWMLLSVIAAYSLIVLPARRLLAGVLIWLPFLLLAVCASWYTIGAWESKATLDTPTLDGTVWMKQARPGDATAIAWLNSNIQGAPVILEATGDSYSEYARVSTFTGLPTVLGWSGHEDQWRGTTTEQRARKPVVEQIYRAGDKLAIRPLLAQYHVQYVYVGPLERQAYGAEADGFAGLPGYFQPVYSADNVTIYLVKAIRVANGDTNGGTR